MKLQNQIKRTLSSPEAIRSIQRQLEKETVSTRMELAESIGEECGFQDPRGENPWGGCLKAMRELEAQGWFPLPPAEIPKGKPTPRRFSAPVPEAEAVPGEAGAVCGLEWIGVERESQMRIWNERRIGAHPPGAGPRGGRPIRYRVGSEPGGWGGFGFAAPARQLADRESGIGGDAQPRRAPRPGLVGFSRFLIRPGVGCRHRASRLLSMSLERLVEDFQRRYP